VLFFVIFNQTAKQVKIVLLIRRQFVHAMASVISVTFASSTRS
jgi:hypothetical protein